MRTVRFRGKGNIARRGEKSQGTESVLGMHDQLERYGGKDEIRKKSYGQWERKSNITFAEEFELYSVDSKELPKISSKCSCKGGKMSFSLPRF